MSLGNQDTYRFFFCTYITCNRRHGAVEAGEVSTAPSGDPLPHPYYTAEMLWPPSQAHPAAAPSKSDTRAPYHGHHHPDQGDEEEGPQHIAHHGVAVGLGGIGHCRVTHDISSQMAEWMGCMGSGGLGRTPPLGRRKDGYQLYLW